MQVNILNDNITACPWMVLSSLRVKLCVGSRKEVAMWLAATAHQSENRGGTVLIDVVPGLLVYMTGPDLLKTTWLEYCASLELADRKSVV